MSKPIVLHIGDPIVYNPEIYAKFSDQFTVIRPSLEERQRPAFLQALKDQKWGDFQAVFRPFWNTGGEMGRWDAEMIPLLPKSMKLFASAGAGFDWADVDLLANEGGFQHKIHVLSFLEDENFLFYLWQRRLILNRHTLLQWCLRLV
jgi:hypothetical protein